MRDNLYTDYCSRNLNIVTNSNNQNGMSVDNLDGVAYADVNGDGYDDVLVHPTLSIIGDNNTENVTGSKKLEFELYIYEDGKFIYREINYDGKPPLKLYLARKILVGDFDNDGDPDFYAAGHGKDGGDWETEPSFFLINDYIQNGSFDYKSNVNIEASHEASSGDLDGDGDLDIFSVGRMMFFNPWMPVYKNDGNFNLSQWDLFDGFDKRDGGEIKKAFNSLNTSEIYDVDNDGNLDIIAAGHDWDSSNEDCIELGYPCGKARIWWGDIDGRFDVSRITLIPDIQGFGITLDIDVFDVNFDGKNEIILNRSGGDSDQDPFYYGGHYLQIVEVDSDRNIIDKTENLIENNFKRVVSDYCDTSSQWLRWLRVEDYDNDGSIDIFNDLVDHQSLHRWEWSGSKFIKVSP